MFERSFMSWSAGLGVCCWSAPSKDALASLFEKAGTPFEEMIEVEEYAGPSGLA